MKRKDKSAIPIPVLDGGRMPAASVLDTVRRLTAEQHEMAIEEITPATHFFDDLDDSLDHVELLMACEEAFGIVIPDADAQGEQLTTVGSLTAYIEGRLGKEGKAGRQPWAGEAANGRGASS